MKASLTPTVKATVWAVIDEAEDIDKVVAQMRQAGMNPQQIDYETRRVKLVEKGAD